MHLYKAINKRLVHIFQLQKFNILYLEIHVIKFYVYFFLFKLKILIQWEIWHNDDFMAC
jgi:hypothetical protein